MENTSYTLTEIVPALTNRIQLRLIVRRSGVKLKDNGIDLGRVSE
jgi:hypothetical protein